jgi:excinuclease ABC subunit A
MDMIKSADWIIDIGPEGGDKGGNVVFEGLPEDLVKVKASYTAKYLKAHLK